MLSLMKWTEPSQKAALTPPGWLLVGEIASAHEPTETLGPSGEFAGVHDHLLGVLK